MGRLLQIILLALPAILLALHNDNGVVFDASYPFFGHLDPHDAPKYSSSKRAADLPVEWDWRDHASLHDQMTQRLPHWCGSCFLFSMISSMTDRLRIKERKNFRNARLSVQAVMNCHNTGGFGNCNGGMTEKVAEFLRLHGTVDETCMPYEGLDRSVTAQGDCTDFMCRDCYSDGSCVVVPAPQKYRVRSWGLLEGEDSIMSELYQRGPVACYVWSHLPAFSEYTGGIMNSDVVFTPGNYTHVIAVIGWGEDVKTGEKYWTFRNWSGTKYGEGGFGRMHRGNNTMNIEHRCTWVEPVIE